MMSSRATLEFFALLCFPCMVNTNESNQCAKTKRVEFVMEGKKIELITFFVASRKPLVKKLVLKFEATYYFVLDGSLCLTMVGSVEFRFC